MTKTQLLKSVEKPAMRSENGQVIILIVGLILGLVAVTALVVDGASVYGLRRNVQNAADNASLAAALALCSSEDPDTAGLDSAADSGFDNDGVSNTVAVSNPPLTGPHAGEDDEDEYVEVLIISSYEPTLTQVLSNASIETRGRAVAHCFNSPLVSDAQVVLDSDNECSLTVSGNGSYTVDGGGIHVDSNDNYALCTSGNAEINADTTVSITGQYRQTGNSDINPSPITGQSIYGDPFADLDPPNNPYPTGTCTTVSVSGSSTRTINPGNYCNVSVASNGTLTLTPGDYKVSSITASGNANLNIGTGLLFIDGGNFSVSGNANLDASEVIIYVEDGDFSVSGNGDIDITAPTAGNWQGMMLFMGHSNTSTISITGNGSVSTTGTIYGALSQFNVSGNGSNTVLNAQVIVSTMNISGNGSITQNFDADDVFTGGGNGNAEISLAE